MCNWILRLIWFIVKKSSSKSSLLLSNFSLSIVRRNWYFFFLGDGLSVTTCINFGSKSSLHFSNLLFSIVRRNWYFFFLSDCLSSDGGNRSFFGSFSFWGYDCWFSGRKLFWNISSWCLTLIKRSWSWSWFFNFNNWLCWLWITFLLVVSTWTWLLVWVVDVFEIILVCCVFKVKWFLELLDTIILIVNLLWNKTIWSIWVDLFLNKSLSFVWSSL